MFRAIKSELIRLKRPSFLVGGIGLMALLGALATFISFEGAGTTGAGPAAYFPSEAALAANDGFVAGLALGSQLLGIVALVAVGYRGRVGLPDRPHKTAGAGAAQPHQAAGGQDRGLGAAHAGGHARGHGSGRRHRLPDRAHAGHIDLGVGHTAPSPLCWRHTGTSRSRR